MNKLRPVAVLGWLILAGCDTHPVPVVVLAPSTLADGLLAHYPFDENSGTIAYDHSGQRRDGTLVGGASFITGGHFGGALHLQGAADGGMGGDYVTVQNFPDTPAGFTVSAWVRTTGTALDGLESVASTELVFEAGWELEVRNDSDAGPTAHFGFWDIAGTPDGGAYDYQECPCVPDNQWTHVAAVVDNAAMTLTLYVADQPVGSKPVQHLISPGSAILYMGTWSQYADPFPRFFVGDIDDVAIYNRPLLASEIQQLGAYAAPDLL